MGFAEEVNPVVDGDKGWAADVIDDAYLPIFGIGELHHVVEGAHVGDDDVLGEKFLAEDMQGLYCGGVFLFGTQELLDSLACLAGF